MTDEAFINRHDASETDERKRFRNYVTYPPVRRSRLSRESESMDTFPADMGLQECASQSDLQASFQFNREEGCRRSGSTSTAMSRRSSFMDEYMGYAIDSFERETFEPFPSRQFPLPEDMFEEMKQEQLDVGNVRNVYHRQRTVRMQDDTSMEFISPEFEAGESTYVVADSPVGSGGSSLSLEDENDPEWNASRGDRHCSLSMRHSKR